jgi:hypothetical protein
MRVRIGEQPPSRQDIDSIIEHGASKADCERFPTLLRRLRKSFFLDGEQFGPLSRRERLIRNYREDGLVLFLGAGVGVESGIPPWPRLAEAVLRKSGLTSEELAGVKRAFPSHITQFELARRRFRTYGDFAKSLYNALYETFDERVRHRTKYLRELYQKSYTDAGYEARLASRRHFWLRTDSEPGPDNTRWHAPKDDVELVMNNLGVEVIWCTDYDDMRACIRDLPRFGSDPRFGRRAAPFPG